MEDIDKNSGGSKRAAMGDRHKTRMARPLRAGVSPATMARCEYVKRHAPDLAEKVGDGAMTLGQAMKETKRRQQEAGAKPAVIRHPPPGPPAGRIAPAPPILAPPDATGLSLSEKAVLAALIENPEASNAALAAAASLSVRGIENMVRRLKLRGIITHTNSGGKRQLTVAASDHTKCGSPSNPAAEIGPATTQNVVPAPPRQKKTLEEIVNGFNEWATLCLTHGGTADAMLFGIQQALKEIEADVPDDEPAKVKAVAALRKSEGRWWLASYCGDHAPREQLKNYYKLIAACTDEQVVEIKERLATGQLAGVKPVKLLAQLSGQ
jgi:hypothetical protein